MVKTVLNNSFEKCLVSNCIKIVSAMADDSANQFCQNESHLMEICHGC
jgi:hypothetical protein